VRDELVVEDRRVGLDLDELDRDRGDLAAAAAGGERRAARRAARALRRFGAVPLGVSRPSGARTSAIMMRRSALAMLASVPVSTNSQ
jgi:hypothetical protein